MSLRTLVAGAGVTLGVLGSPAEAQESFFRGMDHPPIVVIDGDTFRMGETVFRLWGIDAPELGQTCIYPLTDPPEVIEIGRLAAEHLEWVFRRGIDGCVAVDLDRYGRLVAQCWAYTVLEREPTDAARWMVSSGVAWEDARYSDGLYAEAQRDARLSEVGIWTPYLECDPPWEWRRTN